MHFIKMRLASNQLLNLAINYKGFLHKNIERMQPPKFVLIEFLTSFIAVQFWGQTQTETHFQSNDVNITRIR